MYFRIFQGGARCPPLPCPADAHAKDGYKLSELDTSAILATDDGIMTSFGCYLYNFSVLTENPAQPA